MRYFNENDELISVEDVDLEKGSLIKILVIKEDASPIDNITKFAWDDDDYEEAQMYVLNKNFNTLPSQLDRIEAQVTYTAMMTDTLLEE